MDYIIGVLIFIGGIFFNKYLMPKKKNDKYRNEDGFLSYKVKRNIK